VRIRLITDCTNFSVNNQPLLINRFERRRDKIPLIMWDLSVLLLTRQSNGRYKYNGGHGKTPWIHAKPKNLLMSHRLGLVVTSLGFKSNFKNGAASLKALEF